jgi:hypothetical protein
VNKCLLLVCLFACLFLSVCSFVCAPCLKWILHSVSKIAWSSPSFDHRHANTSTYCYRAALRGAHESPSSWGRCRRRRAPTHAWMTMMKRTYYCPWPSLAIFVIISRNLTSRSLFSTCSMFTIISFSPFFCVCTILRLDVMVPSTPLCVIHNFWFETFYV